MLVDVHREVIEERYIFGPLMNPKLCIMRWARNRRADDMTQEKERREESSSRRPSIFPPKSETSYDKSERSLCAVPWESTSLSGFLFASRVCSEYVKLGGAIAAIASASFSFWLPGRIASRAITWWVISVIGAYFSGIYWATSRDLAAASRRSSRCRRGISINRGWLTRLSARRRFNERKLASPYLSHALFAFYTYLRSPSLLCLRVPPDAAPTRAPFFKIAGI